MNNTITLIIIGIYTIIYLIVFVIQKSQIDSMKAFIDIFKVDEVKKYVEIKEERILMQVDQMITDDKKVNEMLNNIVDKRIDLLKDTLEESIKNRYLESYKFALLVLESMKENERKQIIEKYLPKNKEFIIKTFEDYKKS